MPDRHSAIEMHRSRNDATGAPIAVNWLLVTDGAGGFTYIDSATIAGGDGTLKVHGSMGSTETFDRADGGVHSGTLNANLTVTLTAPTTTVADLELWLTQDGTGGRTITWPGSVTSDGTLTPSTTAGVTVRYILQTIDTGTNWILDLVGGGGSALTIKDEGGALATAATSIDFVGAGVVASGTGAAKTVTIAGVTAAAISALGFVGPILMTDGISSPPEPLTTEDGTDYLYMDL